MVCFQIPFCCRYHHEWDTNTSLGRPRAAQNSQIFSLTWIIVWNCFQLLSWWMHRPVLGRCDRCAKLGLHSTALRIPKRCFPAPCLAAPGSVLWAASGALDFHSCLSIPISCVWTPGIPTQSFICQAGLVCADTERHKCCHCCQRSSPSTLGFFSSPSVTHLELLEAGTLLCCLPERHAAADSSIMCI